MGSVARLAEQSHSPFPERPVSENSFSDSVSLLLNRIDCRIAGAGEEREAISRLRYEAYLREGTIAPNCSGTFSDSYDETGNVYVFGLYIDGALASSLRIHVASRDHPEAPTVAVFPDILRPELDAGKVLIDSTRFVTDEHLSRFYRALPLVTVRVGWLAAQYFRAEHLLAAIRVEHQAFYRRTFNHRLICGPRPYPRLTKPISLMTVDQAAVADKVYQRYPFFRSTLLERRMLFERG